MPPRRRKPAQARSVELTEPTEEELLAQLEQATNDELSLPSNEPLQTTTTTATTLTTTTSEPSTTNDLQQPRIKRKYVQGVRSYPRPPETDENGDPVIPGHEYAALSLITPRRKPTNPPPAPPPSLDPNGRPWLYPKKLRQGQGSNLVPFADEIKQWVEEGQSSRVIAEKLIARGVETSDRHIAKQRLKLGCRQRAPRRLTESAIANMRKAKQAVAKKQLPTSGDVSVRRIQVRVMRQAEITRMTKEGMSAAEIAENLSSRGINMRSGAPTVERLQKAWGLINNNNLATHRHKARVEATKRQQEEFTNIARELGVADVDDWVAKKMKEPDVVDKRRRFAYELMGDALPAIARAGIDAAIKRSRRASDKRQFLKQAQTGRDQSAPKDASPQNTGPVSGRPSLSQSTSQSGPSESIEISDQEDGSANESVDGQISEAVETNMTDSDEASDDDGEDQATDTMLNRAQQTSESMDVDSPNSLQQQSAPTPFQADGQNRVATQVANDSTTNSSQASPFNSFNPAQNYSQSQNLGFRGAGPPSWAAANELHLSTEGFNRARLAPAPPTNGTQNTTQASFINIAPRSENASLATLESVPSQPSGSTQPQSSNQPPPTAQPISVHHSDQEPVQRLSPSTTEPKSNGPSWQPTREQADFMAQYNLFPFRTSSKQRHSYLTPAGPITTVGFEYLPDPPTSGTQAAAPNANSPARAAVQARAPPRRNGEGRAPKYPPVVVPSLPLPPIVVPPEEIEKHQRDQNMLLEIQKMTHECMKIIAARVNNQVMENSLTGMPPSVYDIQNAKKRLKEAADSFAES